MIGIYFLFSAQSNIFSLPPKASSPFLALRMLNTACFCKFDKNPAGTLIFGVVKVGIASLIMLNIPTLFKAFNSCFVILIFIPPLFKLSA